MTEEELEARQKILNATCDLLREGVKTQSITVRRIAERAGVGIGLINYHFQSRDKLLNEAVNSLMGEQANLWLDPALKPRLTRSTTSPAAQRDQPHRCPIPGVYASIGQVRIGTG